MLAVTFPTWIHSILAFGVSALLCYFFIRSQGGVHQIAAKVDKRRHQDRPIPLLGGIGIAGGFLIGQLTWWLSSGTPAAGHSLLAFAAMALAVGTGLADDAWELRASWKFLGQNLATLFLLLAMEGVETPPDRWLGHGSVAAYGLKWFWSLGLLNSMNLIDGLDGLASGIGMLAISFFCLFSEGDVAYHSQLLRLALPAILGFYLWNRTPARIYLGESGAQAVAIFLFLSSMNFRRSTSGGADMVTLFLVLGIPILDTLTAILRRAWRRTGLMVPDREHIHHRLGRLGLSHFGIVRFLHVLTFYLCATAYSFLDQGKPEASTVVLALSGLLVSLFIMTTAERKLYFYLSNFASHMLYTLDINGQTNDALELRLRKYREQKIHCAVLRLDLRLCVGNLLEKSPTRIQNFYEQLAEAIRGPQGTREAHFENSRSVVVIQPLQEGVTRETFLKDLVAELEEFEKDDKIDLYLHLPDTLHLLPETGFLPKTNEEREAA